MQFDSAGLDAPLSKERVTREVRIVKSNAWLSLIVARMSPGLQIRSVPKIRPGGREVMRVAGGSKDRKHESWCVQVFV